MGVVDECNFVVGWDPRPDWNPTADTYDERMDRVDCLGWAAQELDQSHPIRAWGIGADERFGYLARRLLSWRRQTELPPSGEVIAVYTRNGDPQHVALRLDDGRWSSKLGIWGVIVHERLESLSMYGPVTHFYVRVV